ncbi:MAG: class I SAM-dependent methyltransferase [Acidobacteriota bacterium]|nr:class I SAM-dependent methyltransferase [Blastocatellia bacterium]MDW8412978.1 class I SAM-dependent methyltransferase [Acidobacteriota bacterium]
MASLKAQIRDFWNANPCGSKFTTEEVGSAEFFRRIEEHRYSTEWHIPEVVGFQRWRGKQVLEVGCGLGTDGVNFARAGADYTGVDLTPRAVELTAKRFELEGLAGRVLLADAEALPFADESFDLTYSHGVLHHTPDTAKAIDELYRVLRPGGLAMVMLYHRNSYNYYGNIMCLRKLGAQLLRFTWGPSLVHAVTGESLEALNKLRSDLLADPKKFFSEEQFLNQNTDGAGNPLAKVYTKAEARKLFARFREVTTEVHFLNKRWLPLIGRFLPRSAEAVLASRWGWHLWIIARK